MTGRRWEVTDEERRRIADEPRRPLVDLARALAARPSLAVEVLRSVVEGAKNGPRTSPDLTWYLGNVRIERAVPGLARGATWYGAEAFMEALRPLLGEELRALELGAGAGRISRLVAPEVKELVVSEPSQAMLDEARTNLSAHPNVSFLRTRGFTLPQLEDETFDLVYSHDVFEFFDGNQALGLLDEARRVTRPGGHCVVSFYTVENPQWAQEQLEVARSTARSGHFSALKLRPYTSGQMEALFRLAGFEVRERVFGGAHVEGGTSQREALDTPEPSSQAELNEAGRCILVGERV